MVDNLAITAAVTVTKWLLIRGITTTLPDASLCLTGVTTVIHMRKELISGPVSRRNKLVVGILIFMAHLTLGESAKTCTPLPLREIESKAQKTILDCFTAYPRNIWWCWGWRELC
jgi:hypothetical protein